MPDYKTARMNMIESQIRPNGITDGRIIDAMTAVPRELFVPAEKQSVAYMDEDVYLGDMGGSTGRSLMEPMAFARLVQLAAIEPGDFVLNIGCASGYSLAVLSHLAQSALAVEQDAGLAELAAETLEKLELSNTVVLNCAHADGCSDQAPFDAIVISGRIPAVPQNLLDQLKEGGRLVAVVGDAPLAQAQLWTRHGDKMASRNDFDATIPALPGMEVERQAFTF